MYIDTLTHAMHNSDKANVVVVVVEQDRCNMYNKRYEYDTGIGEEGGICHVNYELDG